MLNAQRIMPIIIGTAYLTSLMFFAFHFQYQTIKSQSESSSDYMRGEKLKIAGSLDLLDRGEEFGVIGPEEVQIRKNDGYCVLNDGPVRRGTPLALKTRDDCKELHRPVVASAVSPDSDELKSVKVGGKK